MRSFGKTIRHLRQCKGATQEHLAEHLHISCQAVSKWENEAAMPDIMLLPSLADYFGVSIDELFGYKLQAFTYKERFIRLLHHSGAMVFSEDAISYRLETERISTNAQIAQIGGFFADFIRENHLEFDAIMGLAYHGIAFSAATAFALHQKYGFTTSYFHDRMIPDSRGRIVCGYTPKDGDRIVVIDDMMGSGATLSGRLDRLLELARVEIAAVIIIADANSAAENGMTGSAFIAEKYHTQVYSVITDKDIHFALRNGVITP